MSPGVIVIGAGIGGLAAAIDLAARGAAVTVLERAAGPGGKLRQIDVDGRSVDAGPTVFTMRFVFEQLFRDAGARLEDFVALRRADIIARHAWSAHERLDLFADVERSAEEIGRFAGQGQARLYKEFTAETARIYRTLESSFLTAQRPNPVELARRIGFGRVGALFGIRPFETMWRALGSYFPDPRLRQLFGRYATYCGSSPFLAPATLMLVAHVEQQGVYLVDGGMYSLADAAMRLARSLGVEFRFDTHVSEIVAPKNKVKAVRLKFGEELAAGAVVSNADAAALGDGAFGKDARVTAPPERGARSLSALTWVTAAHTVGFPLSRHTVFFSQDYESEFKELTGQRRVPGDPTVYICAQDRDDAGALNIRKEERLLVLINAPADGEQPLSKGEITQCRTRALQTLFRCGLHVDGDLRQATVTTPADFHAMFPATGGALYGPASHGWTSSFARPGARTALKGLYLAGGSVHPGPGVPMAALSGRLAAQALWEDMGPQLVSTARSTRKATAGGTPTD